MAAVSVARGAPIPSSDPGAGWCVRQHGARRHDSGGSAGGLAGPRATRLESCSCARPSGSRDRHLAADGCHRGGESRDRPDSGPLGEGSLVKLMRKLSLVFLLAVSAASIRAGYLTRHGYAEQYRDHVNEAPSRAFPLGTDELGRDRWSRLLYGGRVSLVCAPAAAAVAMAIAALVGLLGGYLGGLVDEGVTAVTDLFLSLPWLFALLTL